MAVISSLPKHDNFWQFHFGFPNVKIWNLKSKGTSYDFVRELSPSLLILDEYYDAPENLLLRFSEESVFSDLSYPIFLLSPRNVASKDSVSTGEIGFKRFVFSTSFLNETNQLITPSSSYRTVG
jgi:hypothetical protein